MCRPRNCVEQLTKIVNIAFLQLMCLNMKSVRKILSRHAHSTFVISESRRHFKIGKNCMCSTCTKHESFILEKWHQEYSKHTNVLFAYSNLHVSCDFGFQWRPQLCLNSHLPKKWFWKVFSGVIAYPVDGQTDGLTASQQNMSKDISIKKFLTSYKHRGLVNMFVVKRQIEKT